MYKKIIALGLFLVLLLSLSACTIDTGSGRFAELEEKIADLEKQNQEISDRLALLEDMIDLLLKGDGSESSPYTIRTAKQFKDFADAVNDGNLYKNTYFALIDDIDLGGEEWTPIGSSFTAEHSFSGVFDGKRHKISNFKITTPANYTGLFATNNGIIKNLGIENFEISCDFNPHYNFSAVNSGGLAGYNVGIITNCYSKGKIQIDAQGNCCVGGLTGWNFNGKINGCYSSADITVNENNEFPNTFSTAIIYAGGLTGYSSGDGEYFAEMLTDCYATGSITVSSKAAPIVGGLVGVLHSGVITRCYATGSITTNSTSLNAYAGGLIGFINNSGFSVTDCYATGDIYAALSYDDIYLPDLYAGGLVGYHQKFTISRCYATGNVYASTESQKSSASVYAGGLVGISTDGGSIEDCLATGNVSAITVVYSEIVGTYNFAGGLVGKNEYGAKAKNSYCYTGQTFFRKENAAEYYDDTNEEGALCVTTQLNSAEFYLDVLNWSGDTWSFSNLNFHGGKLPRLK